MEIDNIKCLLDRYYRAETSPDEEESLRAFFRNVDRDLPEDLHADMKLFAMMEGVRPRPGDSDVPPGLIEKINSIVDPQPVTSYSGKRGWIRLLIGYPAVTAAAAVLVAILTLMPRLIGAEKALSRAPVPEGWRWSMSDYSVVGTADDGFIEINDPEEVCRLVMQINDILADNIRMTNSTILQVTNTLDDYKTLSSSR